MNGITLLLFAVFKMVHCDAIVTVPSLNLTQYSGVWYQMYTDLAVLHSYQYRALCVTMECEIKDNETMWIKETFRRDSPYNHLTEMNGYLYQSDKNTPGNMKKKLNQMPYSTPYMVIKLGPVDIYTNRYQYSVVTDINKGQLFIYARDIDEFRRDYQDEVLHFCHDNGFDAYYNTPRVTPQLPSCYWRRRGDQDKTCLR